ncbi:MAG TPA: hypothetical protein VKP52_12370 [Pseudolabrys sp.]|jgi:hypothetical protein|nr:hypothetical protein [Pseudolabrys sp.]
MALDFRSILPSESAMPHEVAHAVEWHEQVVTVFAASLAVLVVAAIAVLMGMA